MESFAFDYPATQIIGQRAHVGVVGSGDLEVLLEPTSMGQTRFVVRTATEGFQQTWQAVFERFVAQHAIAATFTINDFGATPGVVALRLAQVLEVANAK
jgi:malonate decarboxylase delta subunit